MKPGRVIHVLLLTSCLASVAQNITDAVLNLKGLQIQAVDQAGPILFLSVTNHLPTFLPPGSKRRARCNSPGAPVRAAKWRSAMGQTFSVVR